MIFVLGGFEHSIANMYYLAGRHLRQLRVCGRKRGCELGAALVNNLLPVTIGNIIGGALIGITYWFLYLRGAKKN